MKIIKKIVFIYLISFFCLSQDDLIITSNGKRVINDTISLSSKKIRTLIKNEATFTDNRGNYGISICLGTLEKTENNIDFNLKCENTDQNNLRYWTKVSRGQGDLDAGVGTVEIIGGEGYYKNLVGNKCTYAIKYFRSDIFFLRQVCKL